jgi:hypothetical protein
LDLNLYPLLENGACPNCGRAQTSSLESGFEHNSQNEPVDFFSAEFIKSFFRALKDILFHPAYFFSKRGDELCHSRGLGNLSVALTFAILVKWLAAFFNFVWQSTLGNFLQSRLDDFYRISTDIFSSSSSLGVFSFGSNSQFDLFRNQVMTFLFGAGAILLTPFTTLFKLLIGAFFVHIAVRFLIEEKPDRLLRYSTTLKILCYSSAPALICVIPGFGFFLAWLLTFVSTVIGLREVYRTTTLRSFFVMIFPQIIFIGFLFVAVNFFSFYSLLFDASVILKQK